jgi:hypothetical protein
MVHWTIVALLLKSAGDPGNSNPGGYKHYLLPDKIVDSTGNLDIHAGLVD